MSRTHFLVNGSPERGPRLLFAHGAGAGMDSCWMNAVAEALAERGISVWRFEFPYMRLRREQGRRRPPDAQPVLIGAFEQAIADLGGGADLFIGGKSMGGRMASMIADARQVKGLICVGYPFHPSARPERTRTAHLATLRTPTLIVQGTRDALGTREEVAGYQLSPSIEITWVEDGNHSLEPRKRSGRSTTQAMAQAVDAIAAFALEQE
jgi:uncharacterized protein